MLNEFRQDLISGEWVLFATDRAKRPYFQKDGEVKKIQPPTPIENCPFEEPMNSGNELVWFYPEENKWRIAVFKNKFPAVKPGLCGPDISAGPFKFHPAVGNHDIFIYKDHKRHLSDFTSEEMVEVIRAYKRRYKEIVSVDDCVRYILIFHNFGIESGASVGHPHSQIISLPILPPDVSRSINGSNKFFKENGKNVYDLVVNWERESGQRIVHENERFVAFCPFASKNPYEIRIFSKSAQPHFEELPDDFDGGLAEILLVSLKKMKTALNNPSFNLFIHTAPVEASHTHDYYSWHIEILPRFGKSGGVELATGVDINTIDPDEAAELFRNTNV